MSGKSMNAIKEKDIPEVLQMILTTGIAAFMLCILPLVVNRGYLDISTFKTVILIRWMPVLAGLYLLLCVLNRKWPYRRLQERKLPLIFLGFMVLAFCLSAARSGLSPAVLWGENGRDAGLYFLLCCLLGCFCIGTGKCHERFLQAAIILSGAFIALTGYLNLLGLDPLGMHAGIPEEHRVVFLSTIGNANFYGCALLFSLSLAASMWISGKYPVPGFCFSLVIAAGICCSVTDTALLGMLCTGPILLYMNWGNGRVMRRALLFSIMCILLIPAVHKSMIYWSRLFVRFPGLTAFMIKKYVFIPLALLLFCAWVILGLLDRKGKVPGRPRVWVLLLIFLAAGLLILFAGLRFGKMNYDGVDLKGGEKAEFRIMEFAGKRGQIYDACLRCYNDFSWDQKLFGGGVDNLRSVIDPYLYIDGERIFKEGDILDDAHCQPLHYLLTCGLLGFAAYTGFYLCIVCVLYRRREKTSFADGILLSLLLYLPSFLVNVAQPIMLILFFGAAGTGMSCIQEREIGSDVRKES